jgi:hypothetical protein
MEHQINPTNPRPNHPNSNPGLAVVSTHPKSLDVQNWDAVRSGEAARQIPTVSPWQSLLRLPFVLAGSAVPLAVSPYCLEQGDIQVLDRDRLRSYAR